MTMDLFVPLRLSKRILTLSSIALFANLSQAAIATGDLLITEMMANPAVVSDTNGEWFEIFNTTSNPIDLNGLQLKDNGSNLHTINPMMPLWIHPGDYFVLGRNGDSTVNGGYVADYVYGDFITNFEVKN